MKKMLRSGSYFYFATLLLTLNLEASALAVAVTVAVIMLVLGAADRSILFLLRRQQRTDPVADQTVARMAKWSLPLMLIFAVLARVFSLSGSVLPAVRHGWGLVLLLGAFAAINTYVRRGQLLVALFLVNSYLAAGQVRVTLLLVYTVALLFHLFCITNHKLSEQYGGRREQLSRQDYRVFISWTVAAMIVLVPLLLWAQHVDRVYQAALTEDPVTAMAVPAPSPASSWGFFIFGLLGTVAGIVMVIHLVHRFLQRGKKGDALTENIEQYLAEQGFIHELPELRLRKRFLPPGNRGKVLAGYEKMLAMLAKRARQSPRCLTPCERELLFRDMFTHPDVPWGELTAVFHKARYSDEEVTADDVIFVQRAYEWVAP